MSDDVDRIKDIVRRIDAAKQTLKTDPCCDE